MTVNNAPSQVAWDAIPLTTGEGSTIKPSVGDDCSWSKGVWRCLSDSVQAD